MVAVKSRPGVEYKQMHSVPGLLQHFGLAQGNLDCAIGIEIVTKDGDALHSRQEDPVLLCGLR